jgi:hypothetical protein
MLHMLSPIVAVQSHQPVTRVDSLSKIKSLDQAYSILLRTENFADGGVGIAGSTPEEHYALVYLVRQPFGKSHLLNLVSSSNIHAKLYALCGLYYVDPTIFQSHVAELKTSKLKFNQFSGCIIHESVVGKIIFSNTPGSPRIVLKNRSETIDQAMDRLLPKGQSSFQWDISGGGIPAEIMSRVAR